MENTKREYPPHQQRVIDEASELETKLTALTNFFSNPIFETLTTDERQLLTKQSWAMELYIEVLIERINNFK